MNAKECLETRRSIRKFKSDAIPVDVLNEIVETSKYAPSWKNTQIARYHVVSNPALKDKIANECVNDEKLADLANPSYENLYRFVIDYADGIVVTSAEADQTLVEYARNSGKPMLEYQNPDEAECFDNYKRFYDEL